MMAINWIRWAAPSSEQGPACLARLRSGQNIYDALAVTQPRPTYFQAGHIRHILPAGC